MGSVIGPEDRVPSHPNCIDVTPVYGLRVPGGKGLSSRLSPSISPPPCGHLPGLRDVCCQAQAPWHFAICVPGQLFHRRGHALTSRGQRFTLLSPV